MNFKIQLFNIMSIFLKRALVLFLIILPSGLMAQSPLVADIEGMFRNNLEEMNEVMTKTLELEVLLSDQTSERSELVAYSNTEVNENYFQVLIKFSKGFSEVIDMRYVARNNKLYKNLQSDLSNLRYVKTVEGNKTYYLNLEFAYVFETIIFDNVFGYQISIVKLK